MSLLTYTTAPEDYDYSWARTQVDAVAETHDGKIVRLVEHDDEWHCQQQRMRYGSGLHMAIDASEFARQLELGLLTATPQKRKKHQRKTYEIPYRVSDDNQHLLDTAAQVEAIEGVNTDTRCEDKFIVKIHTIGNEAAFKQACELLDDLEFKQRDCGDKQ